MYNLLSENINNLEAPTHLLINSENLNFLQHEINTNEHQLQHNVDLCYIDPPYNTGNTEKTGFTYNDSQLSENWLQFMEERLIPTKTFLKETGIIIVSIDDSEVHTLRVLMDRIFGRNNFIAQLVIDGGNPKNNAKFFSISHEYMLVYAKNLSFLHKSGTKWRKRREGIDLILKQYNNLKKSHSNNYAEITKELKSWVKQAPISKRLKVFYNADEKGLYTYADLSAPGEGKKYEVLHPITQKPCQVPSRGWGIKQEKLEQLIEANLVIFGKDETYQPMKKLYLKDEKDQVQNGILAYPSRTSTHLLNKILGKRLAFNNPKNLNLMMDLIELVTPQNGLILDYFAGSGTTGHAVLELNKTKDSKRKFVLITKNENNIFEHITRPRLEHVLINSKSTKNTFTTNNLIIKAR
jgi:adenine-specific DNA-methyltransferase